MSTLTPEEKLINAGAIKLDNGKLLMNKFGKYRSNLCYIIDPANISDYKYMDIPSDMNFNVTWDGTPTIMFGSYWVSKKGSNCFAPCGREKAKHILVCLEWGGPHNYGGCFGYGHTELQNAIYQRRASSNGGGMGCNYYIVPADNYANSYSEEDI